MRPDNLIVPTSSFFCNLKSGRQRPKNSEKPRDLRERLKQKPKVHDKSTDILYRLWRSTQPQMGNTPVGVSSFSRNQFSVGRGSLSQAKSRFRVDVLRERVLLADPFDRRRYDRCKELNVLLGYFPRGDSDRI